MYQISRNIYVSKKTIFIIQHYIFYLTLFNILFFLNFTRNLMFIHWSTCKSPLVAALLRNMIARNTQIQKNTEKETQLWEVSMSTALKLQHHPIRLLSGSYLNTLINIIINNFIGYYSFYIIVSKFVEITTFSIFYKENARK